MRTKIGAAASRRNVEKGPYEETDGTAIEAEVLNYQLDTDELLTIEGMGAGLVVVLLLVCLDSREVYFLNLTDAVDKVLSPESPKWREQRSVNLRVPVLNLLTATTPLLSLLRFYGARPKLSGLFWRIHFQWAELGHGMDELPAVDWHGMASHFASSLLRLDIWGHPAWTPMLGGYHTSLTEVAAYLEATEPERVRQRALVDLWFRMDAISRTFEEVSREWGLPTALGQMSSYPPGWLGDDWKALPVDERRD